MIECHEAADESVIEGFRCSGDGVFGSVFLGGLECLLQAGGNMLAIYARSWNVLLFHVAHYSRRFKLMEKSVWLRDGLDLGLETVTIMYDGISGNQR